MVSSRIARFLLWRLTSGGWLYSMIATGWGLILSGLGLGVWWALLALEQLSRATWPPSWPAVAALACIGAGSFILVFEVGWVDHRLAALESMRLRRIRGDANLWKSVLEEQRGRRKLEEKYGGR